MASSTRQGLAALDRGNPLERHGARNTGVGSRKMLVAVNLVGAAVVLASYLPGLAAGPEVIEALWGGLPASLRAAFYASGPCAALGYAVVQGYTLLGLSPRAARALGRNATSVVTASTAAMLVASALWMPLVLSMIEAPGSVTWLAIRVVLAAVAASAVILWLVVARATPHGGRLARAAAVTGATALVLHTVVFDAILWTGFFLR